MNITRKDATMEIDIAEIRHEYVNSEGAVSQV